MELLLSQAVDMLLLDKKAAGKSRYTLRNYQVSFAKLREFLQADPPLAAISRRDLVAFMAWLRDEYVSEPAGVAPRGQIRLSEKSRLNVHTDLSALWAWGVREGFVTSNIVRSIEAPRPQEAIVQPLTLDEVERLLAACGEKSRWQTKTGLSKAPPRSTADRDRALVLLLLDTGARASELCGMRLADLDMSNNRITVLGKGNKRRTVYFGRRTNKALWKYLGARGPGEWVFVTGEGTEAERPLQPDVLLRLVRRMGERAGVKGVHPHRFRHTFATMFLSNGGDVLTLQELLGHTDLKMVKRYTRIVAADCQRAHQRSSPVDNWKL